MITNLDLLSMSSVIVPESRYTASYFIYSGTAPESLILNSYSSKVGWGSITVSPLSSIVCIINLISSDDPFEGIIFSNSTPENLAAAVLKSI